VRGMVFAFIWERPAGRRGWLREDFLFLGGGFLASVRVDKLFLIKNHRIQWTPRRAMFSCFPLLSGLNGSYCFFLGLPFDSHSYSFFFFFPPNYWLSWEVPTRPYTSHDNQQKGLETRSCVFFFSVLSIFHIFPTTVS